MEIKKILVTGFDGYIGAVLVEFLKKEGYEVTGLDNFYYKKNNIGSFDPHIPYIEKDIRDINLKDLKGIDVVVHLAGLSNDPLGEINAKVTDDINFRATIKLAKLAKKAGVKRFVFSSSCSIYGIAKSGVVSERSKVNPLTAYAKSKIDAENELKKIADKAFCVCILRNATVYGYSPKLRTDLVVNDFAATGFSTNELRILSDGSPWRPLIDVRDLSQIFVEFIKADQGKVNAKVFNVGFNENNFQVKDIIAITKKILPSCKINFTGEHGKDARSYKVNFDKFIKAFPHVTQKWPLKKSIKHLISELEKKSPEQMAKKMNYFKRLYVLKNHLDQGSLTRSLRWK